MTNKAVAVMRRSISEKVLVLALFVTWCRADDSVDPSGYILFCPCMGRFGNQMDYFLGSLAFAKTLNRTLVLAPFIEYAPLQSKSKQIAFDSYFRVDSVNEFHRAVTMEYFFRHIAEKLWPNNKRIAFCYQKRKSHGVGAGAADDACASKSGNPSGPFWEHYGVDFVGAELHAPLLYDTVRVPDLSRKWSKRYPADKWPVIAFAGSPAPYPVLPENAGLQRYFRWSEQVLERGRLLRQRLSPGRYLAAHLRIGSDWESACQLVSEMDRGGNLFSSAQCLGPRADHGALSLQLCYPSLHSVRKQIDDAVREINATSVYLATDDPRSAQRYVIELSNLNVQIVATNEVYMEDPQAEMALMSRANLFIGNCVSSFSAVISRSRQHYGLPTRYWNFAVNTPPPPVTSSYRHSEL